MATKINFDEFANRSADGLTITVTGVSTKIDGAALVARRVALQQGSAFAEGEATLTGQWATDPPLDAAGFETGAALALGIETHLMGGRSNPGASASYVTATWAETIEIR